MRIILLNQFFWPDSAATSQLLTDVARELVRRGHEVHAICADGGYAKTESDGDAPGAFIHRVRAVRFARGAFGRLASYASFYVSSAWRALTLPKADVVVTLTTPPLLSLLGTATKLLRGSKHFIWEMDVYPDVAVDLGYIPASGVLDRLIGFLADLPRKYCDGILALGTCMQSRLQRRGIPVGKIMIAENWADGRQIQPVPMPSGLGRLVTLYSGNLGLAHDVSTIQGAMHELRNDPRFRFVFAGGGARRQQLEKHCADAGLSNVEFKSYSSKASLGESLGAGHLGLITQQESCLGTVVPSKIYGLLAAGRPILYIGPEQSTISAILRRFGCGWQIACGDTRGLVELFRKLTDQPDVLESAGRLARKAFLEHYDLPIGVARVCECIGAGNSSKPPLDGKANGRQVAHEDRLVETF